MTVEIDLSGRNAVVTGAGKGIGREVCLELARAGANVFGVSRTKADLQSLGKEVERLGVGYGHLVAELKGSEVGEEIASAAHDALDGIDILVNNAGIADNALAEQVTEEQWDATMDTNLKGCCSEGMGVSSTSRRKREWLPSRIMPLMVPVRRPSA